MADADEQVKSSTTPAGLPPAEEARERILLKSLWDLIGGAFSKFWVEREDEMKLHVGQLTQEYTVTFQHICFVIL